MSRLKMALCQMLVSDNKQDNIAKAVSMIETGRQEGAEIAVLPEMFCCPYDKNAFPAYAENIDNSRLVSVISQAAKYNDMYVIAGSIPELDNGHIYNTSLVFDRQGELIARHRKVHLFDINITNGISFKESEVLSAGNQITVFDTEYCKIGVAICFDIRFSEFYTQMNKAGAKIIITPGAFNLITGPAHWELLVRARALDNQVFHAAVSPARNISAGYVAYGHSMLCDPWGRVLFEADETEQLKVVEICLDEVESVREQIPVIKGGSFV